MHVQRTAKRSPTKSLLAMELKVSSLFLEKEYIDRIAASSSGGRSRTRSRRGWDGRTLHPIRVHNRTFCQLYYVLTTILILQKKLGKFQTLKVCPSCFENNMEFSGNFHGIGCFVEFPKCFFAFRAVANLKRTRQRKRRMKTVFYEIRCKIHGIPQ